MKKKNKKRKNRRNKLINRAANKLKSSTSRKNSVINKFLKRQQKKSKYKSVFGATNKKTSSKKKSKYQSVLKQDNSQQEYRKQRDAQTLKTLEKIKKEQELKRSDLVDSIKREDLKRKKIIQKNTAKVEYELDGTIKKSIQSSWIREAEFRFEERGDRLYVTIFIAKKMKADYWRNYEYTYKVTDKKAWDEMIKAKKTGKGSKGAGTVFWKYYKRGIIVEDNSLN